MIRYLFLDKKNLKKKKRGIMKHKRNNFLFYFIHSTSSFPTFHLHFSIISFVIVLAWYLTVKSIFTFADNWNTIPPLPPPPLLQHKRLINTNIVSRIITNYLFICLWTLSNGLWTEMYTSSTIRFTVNLSTIG